MPETPKLILKKNQEFVEKFALESNKKVYLVGSGAKCDFVIPDDSVASVQVKIEHPDDGLFIDKQNSRSRLKLNGEPLTVRKQITDSDELTFGPYSILFADIVQASSPQKQSVNDTLEVIGEDELGNVFHFKSTQDTPGLEETDEFFEIGDVAENHSTQTQTQDAAENSAYSLAVIYGPYLGKKYPLKIGDTRIGRDNTLNDIVIRNNEHGDLDPSISRRHATISNDNGRFVVSDKRSKTRTYVNQKKLSSSDECSVHEGDEIEIVSDQKSTIFRFVTNELPDYSPPKHAGIWWIRNAPRMMPILSAVFAVITVAVVGISCTNSWLLNAAPEQLKFFEETWYQGPEPTTATANTVSATRETNIAIADLNGDDMANVVFVDAEGRLKVLDSLTKNRLWENDHLRVRSDLPIVLADMNQNDLEDVLVVGQDARLHAFDGKNGAEMWLSPLLGGELTSAPVVNDFDGDGLQDVLVAAKDGQLHIGYGDVFQLNWKKVNTRLSIKGTPSSADIQGDGQCTIFIGTEDGKVIIVDGLTGKLSRVLNFAEKAGTETNVPQQIQAPIAIFDLNDDTVADLLMSSTSGQYLAVDGENFKSIWQEKLHSDLHFNKTNLAPAIGKIDGDEQLDAVLTSNQSLKIIQGGAQPTGTAKVLWEYYAESDDYFISPVTLVDLNKDGANEVIVAGLSGSIFLFNGINGKIISQIHNESNPVASSILAADIDDDELTDLLFTRQDGNIYRIQTNSPIKSNAVIWGQAFSSATHHCTAEQINSAARAGNIAFAAFGLLFAATAGFTFTQKKSRQNKIRENRGTKEHAPL